MVSSLKRAWAHPWIRRPLLVALGFAVVLGVCWIILDRLGKEAWGSFERELAAEGETTDFLRLLSRPVPEAENFCAILALRNLALPDGDSSEAGAEGKANRARIAALKLEKSKASSLRGIRQGLPLDFAALAKGMREEGGWPVPDAPGRPVEDVNAGYGRWDSYLAELAAGLARPRAQWTPSMSERTLRRPYLALDLPHLAPAFELGKIASLRAAVAGAAGDLPKAIESLRIAKRLAMAFFDEPLLIDGMVAQAIEGLSVNAIWEICRSQQGNADDWRELEGIVRAYDVRAATLRIYRGEMAVGLDSILFARDGRGSNAPLLVFLGRLDALSALSPELDASEQAAVTVLRLAPPGFFDSVAMEFGSKQMQYLIRPLRDEGWLGMMQGRRAMEARLNYPGLDLNFPSRFGKQSLWNFARSVTGSVYLQVLLDQAAIACVLERTRLAAGAYPDSLEGLTLADGSPLPLDACTGQPMHYRQTADSRYVLWSEGPNGRDDNASRGLGPPGHSVTASDYAGDWVWGFEAAHDE